MDETFHDYTLATNLERFGSPAVLPAVPGQTAPAVADSAGIVVLVGSLLYWSRLSGDGCSQVRELSLYSPATAASFVQPSQRHTTCKADAAHSACFAVALQWPSTSTPSRTLSQTTWYQSMHGNTSRKPTHPPAMSSRVHPRPGEHQPFGTCSWARQAPQLHGPSGAQAEPQVSGTEGAAVE